jgi:hypothetical protein
MTEKSTVACKALRIVFQQWMILELGPVTCSNLEERQIKIRKKIAVKWIQLQTQETPESISKEEMLKLITEVEERYYRDIYYLDNREILAIGDNLYRSRPLTWLTPSHQIIQVCRKLMP